MGNELRVEPAALHESASQIDVSADDLRARHVSVHVRITNAQTGWIGASAAALSAKAVQWEEESAAHYTELVKHGQDIRSAAASYLHADCESGSEIDGAGSKLGDLGL